MTVGVHAMPGAAPRMTRATLAPMTGKIGAYDHLPETARAIREQVFIRERDWRPEFDEWDAVAVHLLAFDGNRTVATCRFYADPDHSDQPGRYVIARLAVLPDAQGRGTFGERPLQVLRAAWISTHRRTLRRRPPRLADQGAHMMQLTG